ncbi:MAG: TlyA family RNA methyltransferase [Spirochaetes bacterium]|nr:TlyA family RNA methyltransferase [Spirochaetota bacterium]
MPRKKRLDVYLTENEYVESREQARREILAGWVRVNGELVRKPAHLVTGDERISIERPGKRFVSRGGEKLDYALKRFSINLDGRVVADLGASTGGFTHCMLLHGAAYVYAIDVGYGQLDYRLRQHPQVAVMERTHVKDLVHCNFNHRIDFVTADLSFISLTKVFDVIARVFPDAEYLFLVKPQFEAKREEHKKGVVKDAALHEKILQRLLETLCSKGFAMRGLCPSPIKGPAGNIEFFVYGFYSQHNRISQRISDEELTKVVLEAHRITSS